MNQTAEYKTLLACRDRLVTALSNDLISISGKLLANGIISEGTYAQILLPSSTPQEKATVLVNSIQGAIENNPRSFFKFVSILSGETWNSSITDILHSAFRGIIIMYKVRTVFILIAIALKIPHAHSITNYLQLSLLTMNMSYQGSSYTT